MMRWVNISLAVVLIAVIAALYHIRYSAEAEARVVRQLERQINQQHDLQRTLQAEWSSLNDPRRLQLLARDYLKLDYLRASQIIDMRHQGTHTVQIMLNQNLSDRGGAHEPR